MVVVVAVETRGLPSIQACTNIGEDKAARGLHTLNSDYHVHIRLGLFAQPYCLLFQSTLTSIIAAIAGDIKEATSHLPDEAMDAVSTPMDLILPASPSSDVGALYLGSLFAFFDPERLTSHSIGALVQFVEAAWLAGPKA